MLPSAFYTIIFFSTWPKVSAFVKPTLMKQERVPTLYAVRTLPGEHTLKIKPTQSLIPLQLSKDALYKNPSVFARNI